MKHRPYYELEKKVTWALCNAYEVYNEFKSRGKHLVTDEMYAAIQHLEVAQNYLQWMADNEKEESE